MFCTSVVTDSIVDSGVIACLSKLEALKPPWTYEKFNPPRGNFRHC